MWRALLLTLLWAAPAWAGPPDRTCSSGEWSHVECIRDAHFAFDVCQMLESQARVHGLDPGFFARLIWQESRFDANALSHADAMGIAQFIASTAKLRGLTDPYDPAEALEHSAQYLGEMQRRYGNAGLAAVGYNGGERRAEGLIAKTGGLARETVRYVEIITGIPAEQWRDAPPEAHDFSLAPGTDFRSACLTLAKARRITPMKAAPPPRPALAAWGVQMAYGATPDTARRAYERRSRQCASAVRGEVPDMVFVQNRVARRDGYYMARIGRPSRRAASDLCIAVRAAGCLCQVYRND
ncbi:MAG: lytic transglycosylase domain-containing protein [Shimia sp.]